MVSNLGINDVMDWESSNGSFVDDYLALIQDYRELGTHPKVLLWTPLAPLFPGQTFHGDPHVAEIGRSIEVVARRARARTVDMEPALNEHPDWFPDHIHPDARGAAAIAGVVRAGLADSRFIDADPRRVRLYVLTGQSNALGTTADRNAVDTSPGAHPADASTRFFWRNRSTRGGDENAASLGDSGGEWTTLQVQQGEGSNKTFWGPDFGFARSLHASGERDFAIVKACRSGGGNGLWSKDSDDDHMYRLVVDTVDAAIEALPPSTDVEVAALLYLQGESDNLSEARASKERLVELARNLRRDLPDATRMRVLVAGIAAPGTTRDLVRAGQREAAQRDPSISYVSTLDLVERLYDGLHFDRTAKIELGRRFARTWAAMGGVSAWRSTKR